MNLSKSRLKQIILEELQRSLNEQEAAPQQLSKGRMRIMANALCFGQGQKVMFRNKAGKNIGMGGARKDTSWKCPGKGSEHLGYKDWSDARKLARGDSAKFQQFIQSKKGGAGGQQSAVKLYKEWLTTYINSTDPVKRASILKKLQDIFKNKKMPEAARAAAKAVLAYVSRKTGAPQRGQKTQTVPQKVDTDESVPHVPTEKDFETTHVDTPAVQATTRGSEQTTKKGNVTTTRSQSDVKGQVSVASLSPQQRQQFDTILNQIRARAIKSAKSKNRPVDMAKNQVEMTFNMALARGWDPSTGLAGIFKLPKFGRRIQRQWERKGYI